MSERKTLIVPSLDLPPAHINFGVVTGDGVPDYENRKGRGDGMEYVMTIKVDKATKKQIQEEFLEYWEDNKSKKAPKKPDNFDGLFWENEDGDTLFSARTKTEFNGKPKTIQITDAKNNKLDPEVFGSIGDGSTGRIVTNLSIYNEGSDDEGIGYYLEAVRLITFSPYTGGSIEIDEEEGDALGGGGAPAEKKKGKKKKKKSKE